MQKTSLGGSKYSRDFLCVKSKVKDKLCEYLSFTNKLEAQDYQKQIKLNKLSRLTGNNVKIAVTVGGKECDNKDVKFLFGADKLVYCKLAPYMHKDNGA